MLGTRSPLAQSLQVLRQLSPGPRQFDPGGCAQSDAQWQLTKVAGV